MGQQHDDDHPPMLVHFERNQIHLLVSHDKDADLSRWFEEVFQPRFQDVIPSLELTWIAPLPRLTKIVKTRRKGGLPLELNKSLLYLQLPSTHDEPDEQDAPRVRREEDLAVVDTITQINSILGRSGRGKTFRYPGPRVTAHAAAPNWLFVGTPHQIIDGGPGGKPVPNDPAGTGAQQFTVSITTPAQAASATTQNCEAPAVDVFILDTAPPEPAYSQAVARLTQSNPPINPLLKRVAANLKIVYQPALGNVPLPVGPAQNPAYVSHRGNYEISDHGLFIAGIIHTLAPGARLHLLEILNSNGAGTVETLMQGISAITRLLPPGASRVIINCSLCISFSSLQAVQQAYNWMIPAPYTTFDQYAKNVLLAPLQNVIQAAYSLSPSVEIAFVAAAGNDGDGSSHPDPRYPAALPRVIGVGSSDHTGALAPYSNIDDNPRSDGVVTFGGLTKPITPGKEPLTDDQEGMLGLYIGNFPDGSPSRDGWARWSGTSFAAAVMSGMIAQRALDCWHIDNSAGDFFQAFKASFSPPPAGQALTINADQI